MAPLITGVACQQDSVTVRSNGCVHLTQPAAQTFYNTLHVGDEHRHDPG
ncbi:MAG: hypothetical protein WA731_07785 [Pseudonocardiaceae bacterium]